MGRKYRIAINVFPDSHIKIGMFFPISRFLIIFQKPKHGIIAHPMTINNGMKVGKITLVRAFQKNGSAYIGFLFPIMI